MRLSHLQLLVKLSLMICLALSWSACRDASSSVPESEPRPVYTYRVPPPSETIQRGFSGSLSANEGLNYGFEVGGRIVQMNVKAGEFLEKGRVIARLDTVEFENQVRNAEAQFKKADAELKRTRLLNETGNASNASLEQAIANQLRAKTDLDTAAKHLKDTTLLMPYDGVIGSVLAELQQIINPGEGVVRIQGDGNLEMTVGIPARWLNDIHLEDQAMIQLGSVTQTNRYPARVLEVSRDMSRNTTYPVVLQLESDDDRLREGMDGEAFFHFPNPNGTALLIPFTCIASSQQDQPYVWKVMSSGASHSVSRHVVRIGLPREDGMVEILEGVQPDDLLVTRGVHRCEEGMPVRLLSE